MFNDLKYLHHIKPTFLHTKTNLQPIWDKIFEEYSVLSASTQSNHILELLKEVKRLEFTINLIQSCLTVLHNCSKHNLNVSDYQPTIDTLKSYGYYYEYSNLSLMDDMTQIINESKALHIDLADNIAEYNTLTESKKAESTESDFLDEAAIISKFNGFAINPRTTTVIEYISYLSVYKKANA